LSADDRVAVSARELHRDDLDGTVIEIDGVAVTLDATVEVDVVTVRGERGFARFELMPRFTVHAADEGGGGPICPLPGTVIAVHVSDGDHVAEGALLMVVEAMKMEHRITAAAAGVVDDVRFAVGDRVDTGDLLVAFHADE
jgi:propionyl-CoA carboxylase alpha chain